MKMDKCPKCKEFSVSYDSYRRKNKCIIDGCTAIVIDENTYSYLKHDYERKVAERVKIINGIETEVIKTFNLEL
ncbi:MAG: hypothetical protein AABX88_01910 [Nanoarchaeota archaeon]